MSRRVIGFVGASILVASPFHAQAGLRFSVGGGLQSTYLNAEGASGIERSSGFTGGAQAAISFGRLGVGLKYLEGSVTPAGAGAGRDIIEGEALLSLRAFPWLALRFGPHIRSVIRTGTTERWVLWEGRVRTRARLGSPRLTSSLELWYVLSGDVSAVEGFDGGQGVKGLLRWEVTTTPIWLGIGYQVDRTRLGGGSRAETWEHFVFVVGFGSAAAN